MTPYASQEMSVGPASLYNDSLPTGHQNRASSAR